MIATLFALILLPSPAPLGADTLLRTPSTASVPETVSRLQSAAAELGLTVFAVVDHAANARAVALDLPPATMVLLGNPRAGTLLMQCSPTVAVDLPLRVLVWEASDRRVWVGHHDPRDLLTRHSLEACGETLDRIAGVLERLRGAAAGGGRDAP